MLLLVDELTRRSREKSDINEHLPRLFAEADRPDVKVLELGVRSGNSTSAFLVAAEKNGGCVWSVDPARPRVPAEWFDLPFWTFISGNDLEVGDQLPAMVDVLFIDTTHAYKQTLEELRMFAPRVKSGGVILLHDTELERPDLADAGDPAFPVAEAIKVWASEEPVERSIEWVSGCYGLAVVKV